MQNSWMSSNQLYSQLIYTELVICSNSLQFMLSKDYLMLYIYVMT